MYPFVTVQEVEDEARRTNRSAILLLMAEYSGEKTGPIGELLHRVVAYDAHSNTMTDILCAGYSDLGRFDEPDLGQRIKVEQRDGKDGKLQYFFPDKFHDMRLLITESLGKTWNSKVRWNYEGGVDLLLFPTTGNNEKPIDWTQAAIVRSQKHVDVIFKDVDQMIRTVINLNEAEKGQMHPDQLRPEITDRVLKAKLAVVTKKVGPELISKAIEFFSGKPT